MKKSAERIFAICFCLFLFVVLGVTVHNNGKTVSYYENRQLARAPEFSKERLLSGKYFSEWESWLTDHAAGRNTLLKANTWLRLNMLRQPVVSNVIVDSRAMLRYNDYGTWDTSYLYARADEIGESVLSLEQYIEEYGGSFYYLGIPDQSTYFTGYYPDYLENRAWNVAAVRDSFAQALNKRGIRYLDLSGVYDQLGHPDELYTMTDHHYSIYGAWTAYRAVMERINAEQGWNLSILGREDLDWTTLPNPFLGSHARKLFGLRTLGERLTVAIPKDPVAFTREDNGAPVNASVLDLPASADAVVTYGVFMGGDQAETVLRTDRPELPDLLVFGDSFTNAMETLLYTGFDETRSIDLRYYSEKTLRDYIADYQPDIVICVRDDTAFFSQTGNGALG